MLVFECIQAIDTSVYECYQVLPPGIFLASANVMLPGSILCTNLAGLYGSLATSQECLSCIYYWVYFSCCGQCTSTPITNRSKKCQVEFKEKAHQKCEEAKTSMKLTKKIPDWEVDAKVKEFDNDHSIFYSVQLAQDKVIGCQYFSVPFFRILIKHQFWCM